jgi:cobalamin biosynthesis Co2+ chelatase CbiK
MSILYKYQATLIMSCHRIPQILSSMIYRDLEEFSPRSNNLRINKQILRSNKKHIAILPRTKESTTTKRENLKVI